jgi:hypothetical protein
MLESGDYAFRMFCRYSLLVVALCSYLASSGWSHADEESLSPYERRDVNLLVKQLGDQNFDERESAQSALMHMSPAIIGLLESQLDNDDPEIKVRIWMIVNHLKKQRGVTRLLASGLTTDGNLKVSIEQDGRITIRNVSMDVNLLSGLVKQAKLPLDTTVLVEADRSLDWKHVTAVFDQLALVGLKGVSFSSNDG